MFPGVDLEHHRGAVPGLPHDRMRIGVRRGDKWRSFAELNGAVLAWQRQKIYAQVTALGPLGAVGEVITFDLDYAR